MVLLEETEIESLHLLNYPCAPKCFVKQPAWQQQQVAHLTEQVWIPAPRASNCFLPAFWAACIDISFPEGVGVQWILLHEEHEPMLPHCHQGFFLSHSTGFEPATHVNTALRFNVQW